MTNTTLRNIAIVGGIVLFVPAFVISPALGVVLAVILIGAFMAAQRILGASEVRLKKEDVGDLLNRMWIPVRDELSVVVRTGGRVTSATSVWSGVPNLYKQEAPTTFHEGMERYVNERAQVAALVASVTATLESRQQQEIEQQKLLFMSRELLEEARKVINFIPGSDDGRQTSRSRATKTFGPTNKICCDQAKRRINGRDGTGGSRIPKCTSADCDSRIYHKLAPCPVQSRVRSHEFRGNCQDAERARTTVQSRAGSPEDIGYYQDPGTRRRTAYST